jgi:prepilin-type N-terminal cleavage/methylation domain-containing protein
MRFSLSSRISPSPGFTIIEIMVVIAIIAIVMTTSIPMMWKALQKDDLARAVNDVMEGCKLARDRAILNGATYEFIVTGKGDMSVAPAPQQRPHSGGETPAPSNASQPNGSLMAGFPRHLGEEVIIQLIGVNDIELMDEPEAHVRFFPNGTSDSFTIVFMWHGAQRTVTTDIVTGLPEEFIK